MKLLSAHLHRRKLFVLYSLLQSGCSTILGHLHAVFSFHLVLNYAFCRHLLTAAALAQMFTCQKQRRSMRVSITWLFPLASTSLYGTCVMPRKLFTDWRRTAHFSSGRNQIRTVVLSAWFYAEPSEAAWHISVHPTVPTPTSGSGGARKHPMSEVPSQMLLCVGKDLISRLQGRLPQKKEQRAKKPGPTRKWSCTRGTGLFYKQCWFRIAHKVWVICVHTSRD